MFRGLNPVSLDAKGRLAMPAKYREIIDAQCQGRLVVTIEDEGQSLVIYPVDEFEKIQQVVMSLSSFDPATKRLKRIFVGHATDVELDGSGRILIPPTLRGYVDLDKKAILVGQGNKLELWSEEVWEGQRDGWLKEKVELGTLPEVLKNLSI
jgi:MraZ protein